MFKKLLLTSFLLFSVIFFIYPTKKENIELFNYCHSLEKILSRNTIIATKKFSGKFKSISKDVTKIGVSKTKGALINKIIDQYKTTKNSFIINLVPNQFYCLVGYWAEKVNPGTFESIFYAQGKKLINEFQDLKDLKDIKNEVSKFINDFNSQYKSIEEELESLFNP